MSDQLRLIGNELPIPMTNAAAQVRPQRQPRHRARTLAERKAEAALLFALAPSTQAEYERSFTDFQAFCHEQPDRPNALPAEPRTIAAYLLDLTERVRKGDLTYQTLKLRLNAIASFHHRQGFDPNPAQDIRVRRLLMRIRAKYETAPEQKHELRADEVRAIVRGLEDSLVGVRDKALLLLTYFGCFKRSEIVSLDIEHLTLDRHGLVVSLRHIKRNPKDDPVVGIPYGKHPETCPVRALKAWLRRSGIAAGPLFPQLGRWAKIRPRRLTVKAVARILKERAEAVGLDAEQISSHSLRAGFLQEIADAGASTEQLMAHGRYVLVESTQRFHNRSDVWKKNAAVLLDL